MQIKARYSGEVSPETPQRKYLIKENAILFYQ